MGRKSEFSQEQKVEIYRRYLDINCKMKLELRNWDKGACPFYFSVPGMALIQSETVRPQVFTAKCSEPQAIAVKRGGRKWCDDFFERTNRNLIQG